MRALFDHGPLKNGTSFNNLKRLIIAENAGQVDQALSDLQSAHSDGYWLAGYASYELGYAFSGKLQDLLPDKRKAPLLCFGVFDAPEDYVFADAGQGARLSPPQACQTYQDYLNAFETVQDYIRAGDIYQANLTFPMRAHYEGDVEALYALLRTRQPVSHGALVDLGGLVLLSRSPELFFSIDTDRVMTCKPMKGTVKRGQTEAEDAAKTAWLKSSEKNRAENLMIVDLLRNDMGRIAEIGSVKVPDLFAIESYATLHQMVSRVTARICSGTSIGEIFKALFPCGSITGAPKIRAMQIIREIESVSRGAYCGSIGWIAPDGRMSFNVAIRTLSCWQDGSVDLNVGGGIVYDSTPKAEYDEAILKAQYAHIT